jgi:hypothetical protein
MRMYPFKQAVLLLFNHIAEAHKVDVRPLAGGDHKQPCGASCTGQMGATRGVVATSCRTHIVCVQLCAPSGSSPGNTALTSLECLLGHSACINHVQMMQTSNATGCALHTATSLKGRLAVHIPTIVYSRPHVVPTVADAAIQACYVYGLDT